MKVGISFGYHPGHPPDDMPRTRAKKRRRGGEKDEEEDEEEKKKKTVKVLSGQRRLTEATELKRLD